MTNIVQIGIQNDQYDISSADTTYHLAYGKYILQTKDGGLAGIREISGSQNNTIQVDGAIGSSGLGGYGLYLDGLNTTVHVGTSGSINAERAILTYGDNTHISNDGEIHGDVYLVGSKNSSFSNMGSLNGAVKVSSSEKCDVEIGGSGVVNAAEAIHIDNQSGLTSYTTNSGSVTGSEYAFSGGDGEETLVNRGSLKGAVSLGAGNDLFDNRLGSVDHIVKGGAGNDVFIVDTKIAISELSGQGTDTVKSTISMNLSTGVLSGQSLEKLVLIGTDDANGTGNALANTIIGNTHNNRLSGLSGADVLDGGRANDKLTGGLGADTFVFKTGYGHDTVTDFGNGGDRLNLKGWNAITDLAGCCKTALMIVSGSSGLVCFAVWIVEGIGARPWGLFCGLVRRLGQAVLAA